MLPGRQLQGRSHAPAAMSTGGLWWAEQYLKAPRVHIWLAQRPVLALCTQGPPAAPPAGCTVIHLQASMSITLGWVRGAYRCSFAISGPLYLLTDSVRGTHARHLFRWTSYLHVLAVYSPQVLRYKDQVSSEDELSRHSPGHRSLPRSEASIILVQLSQEPGQFHPHSFNCLALVPG